MTTVPEEAVKAYIKAFGNTPRTKDMALKNEQKVRHALTAALPHLPGVGVKKLEWRKYRNGDAEAVTPFGEIYTAYVNGYWRITRNGKAGKFIKATGGDDVDAAKAGAQADFDANVLQLVHSQAVELLAAERAENEAWKNASIELDKAQEAIEADHAAKVEQERLRFEGDLDKWMKIIGAGITGYQPEAYALMDLACEELVTLRADNAALTARIAELEQGRAEFIDQHVEVLEAKLAAKDARIAELERGAYQEAYNAGYHARIIDTDRQGVIADVEAKLAVMREALGDLVSWFSDPSEYGPWIIKSGKHGADDAVEHARAALGGKLS